MKILIVEDDADSGEALMQLLGDFGYEVEWVMCPTLASNAAVQFQPDVAILDIGLPMISGYDLMAMLRSLPQLEACRFLAVSAFVGDEIEQRSSAAGFDQHLTKPLNIPKLLDCLKSVRARPQSLSA
ncbi:MAG TPA: response regulator [Polyangiaceae bacterium]|nr:response regulator [Polyangiaceae bacterium]